MANANHLPLSPDTHLEVEDILITGELASRPVRTVNWAAEVEAFRTLTRVMATSPGDLIDALLQLALQLCRADTAGLSLLETPPDGETIFRWTNLAGVFRPYVGGFTLRHFSPCGTCLDRHSPQLFSYPSRLFQYLNAVDIPVVEALVIPLVPIGDDPLGTIWIVNHIEGKHFDAEDVRIMTSLAEFTSTALRLERGLEAERQARRRVEEARVADRTAALLAEIAVRQKAEDDLRELNGRLLTLRDDERRRIARDLHDSAGQLLTAASMSLASVAQNSNGISPDAAIALSDAADRVQETIKEVRIVAHLLHPPLLDEAGLPSALRWYLEGFSERSDVKVDLVVSDEFGRLAIDLETAIFRVVQECLTNIHRHSGSKTARVEILRLPQEVRLRVEDRGKGIPVKRLSGVGLRGMRERVGQFGGQLDVQSSDLGTTVLARLPLASCCAEELTA